MGYISDDDYRSELSDKINIELPFTAQELTDGILTRAINDSLRDMDRWHPNVIPRASYDGDGSDLIRSYISVYDRASIEPYIDILGYDMAEVHLVAVKWTLESIHENISEKAYFDDLVKYKAGMSMANVRRSATMNNLPFDIKGDQFYQECKDSHDALLTLLQNTAQTTY